MILQIGRTKLEEYGQNVFKIEGNRLTLVDRYVRSEAEIKSIKTKVYKVPAKHLSIVRRKLKEHKREVKI